MTFFNYTNSTTELPLSGTVSSFAGSSRLPKSELGQSTSELKVLSGICSIASIIGIVGNVLVCFVVTKFRFLGRPKAELFIVSLAVADLMVCIFAQPMYVIYLHGLLPKEVDLIRKAITWVSTLVSVSHLFAISLERFFSLYFIHRFSVFIREQVIWNAILLTWLIAIGFGAPSAVFRKARIVSQYFVIAMLLVIPLVYAGTFYIVRLQQRRINKQIVRKTFYTSQKSLTSERKIVYMIAVVVGVFYLCFTPLLIVPFFFSVKTTPAVRVNALRAFPWVNTIALLNSSLNPYIYYWRSFRFRLALELILRRIFEKK